MYLINDLLSRWDFTIFNLILAFATADPHFVTLDRNYYSYSGLGEYVLMQTDEGNGIVVQVITFKVFAVLVY